MLLLLVSLFLEIDAQVIEDLANDILSPENTKESRRILQHLGNARTNRVFKSFGIEAPLSTPRVASQAGDSEAPMRTVVIEWKKQRKLSEEGGSWKHHHSSKWWFSSSPLNSKGDSEDVPEEGEVHSPVSTPPRTSTPTPLSASPSEAKGLYVECSALEPESDEEAGVTLNVHVVDSSIDLNHPLPLQLSFVIR